MNDTHRAETASSKARPRKQTRKIPRHTHTWFPNEYMTELDDMAWWDDCACGARRQIDMDKGTTVYDPRNRTRAKRTAASTTCSTTCSICWAPVEMA